ncbi:hypothetical protein ACJRO7_013374 [Eucalyptus globulus]|uniref:Mannosyltransferase n=1 Tax=Eucalyptus globulus TaxID=34317 RepID=A0ABD3KWL3_EUCGL
MRQRHHVSATAGGGQVLQDLKDPPEEKLEESYLLNSLLVQTYFDLDEHWQALEVVHCLAFGLPVIFALLYKVLAVLFLDKPQFMMKAPRLLQSIFSAVGDLYLYKISRLIFGNCVARWVLFSELTNWFMFFCITWTLSTSLETVLTIMGLYYWPCLRISSLPCLLELSLARDRMRFICLEVLPVGALVLGLATLLDQPVHGSWVLVFVNFFMFNFLSFGGDYYGTHKWHWYFTQGFTRNWRFSGLIAWVLVLYYICRPGFFLPVLLIALMFSGFSLTTTEALKHPNCPSRMRWAICFLLVLWFSGLRGSADVMTFLSREAAKDKVKSILFLMPCHARRVPDESDHFIMDPVGITEELANNWLLLSHIVSFESEERALREFFAVAFFQRDSSIAHFKVDRDLQSSVVVYALTAQ